jgi:hypothetical protein
MNKPRADDEHYSEAETVARREAALKRMLNTPPVHKSDERAKAEGAKRGRPKRAVPNEH